MSPEACGTAQIALARMKADPFMQANPLFAIPPSTTISCTGYHDAGLDSRDASHADHATRALCLHQWVPRVAFAGRPVDPDWGDRPVVDTPDPRDPTLFPVGVPLTPPITRARQPGQQDLRQGDGPGGPDQIDYQFVVRSGYNFTILFNSSVGAMKEGIGSNWLNGVPADGKRLLDLMRAMPNTDLNFATLSSGNTDHNAWRDSVYWAEAVRPKIMTTGHAPVGAALQYYSGFVDQLKLMEQPKNAWPGFPRAQWPIIRNHTDPTDVLKPQVYGTGDPAWFSPDKAAKVSAFCS